ncbi:HAMP domain-containing sensor histidine kinase [Embleya sp. NPDC005575]|uniref:sensor histidine kinase n=1 Tax=Embleya sp. NPDC005575 TaxID=3156892 RepID=UPI0033B3A645
MSRPRLPRTLRVRLTAGLVVLLALACAAVGVGTVLALEGFLIERLDQQLVQSGGRFPASLEHEGRPDDDNRPDTRGQADGTLGARLLDGHTTDAAVVHRDTDRRLTLTNDDAHDLAGVPVDGRGHDIHITGLGTYRVVAVRGDDGDVLITGLPLHPIEETVHRLEAVETLVFGAALLVTGAAAAYWVRLSLRPLDRVVDTATRVAELPLAGGEVAMPEPLPDTDPHTEVGRVGAALNRMLGHIGDALTRRQAVEERLRNFAADAGHELRTPVATLRGHAELALRHPGPIPPEIRHALERMQSESLRMSTLVEDLLLLARLDAGRPLVHEPVDLTRLVLDATGDARASGPDHRWILDLPEEPITVTGDEHRLHQVVANLLANARTHTPPGTDVTVRLESGAAHVVFTVTDNGPGVPEPIRRDVFDRFVRADTGRSRTAGNTGLGLAIVKAVVTAHHGTVTLTQHPDHTEFRVELPR